MTIRAIGVDDLQTVLGWAADEGWNPGHDDAAAFHAADPDGFLVKEVEGAPIAAISVVNHDAHFAFLGLYLCKPAYRGQGHGMDVWRAGIAHAGQRTIGLDGVPDQQANYARSGFVKHGSTVRFAGSWAVDPDPRVRPAVSSEIDELIARDAAACGVSRTAFARAWFAQTPNRQTMVLVDGADIKGCTTFRRCQQGAKIGPLYAYSEGDALALLASNPFPATAEALFIDTTGHDSPLAGLIKARGFAPVFETARMFTGDAPAGAPAPFHAIATMELG